MSIEKLIEQFEKDFCDRNLNFKRGKCKLLNGDSPYTNTATIWAFEGYRHSQERLRTAEEKLEYHEANTNARVHGCEFRGWQCFHCGEVHLTVGGARDHFGADPTKEPGCLIKVKYGDERGLEMELRKVEGERDTFQYQISNESTEADLRIQTLQGDHQIALRREEEKGYASGLKDYTALESENAQLRQQIEASQKPVATIDIHLDTSDYDPDDDRKLTYEFKGICIASLGIGKHELYASPVVAPANKDTERLDFMLQEGANIGWGKYGEKCALYSEDKDEFGVRNRLNGNKCFSDPREAIDHAISLQPHSEDKPS